MNWENYIKGFISYLQLEKSLSLNSIKSYERDIKKLSDYFININNNKGPDKITTKEIRLFLQDLTKKGLSSSSQSRILSGIKAFYKYLILEQDLKMALGLNINIDHDEDSGGGSIIIKYRDLEQLDIFCSKVMKI